MKYTVADPNASHVLGPAGQTRTMPAKKRFTPTWLKSLLDIRPAEDTTYSEAGRVGFILRHRTGGALVWLVRYQRQGLESMAMHALVLQRADHALDHAVLLKRVRCDELLPKAIAAHQRRVTAAGKD